MMTNRMNGRTRVSVGASGVVAVLMLAAACESPPPTMAVPEAAATLQEAPGPAAALQPSEGGVVRLSTLTARTDAPLVYVDGVRLTDGDASALAPETIDRIEVLKGDAAEAWFGDGGENGVIQIFTKEPRPAVSGGVARFEPEAEGEMSFGVLSRRDRPDS